MPRKSLQTNFKCCSLFVSLQPTDPCPSLRVSPRRSRSRSRSCGIIATDSARSTSCVLTSRLVRSQPSPPSFQVEEWPSKGSWHCPVALWPVHVLSLNRSTPAVEPQEPQELDVAPGAFQLRLEHLGGGKRPGLRLAAQASPEHAPTCTSNFNCYTINVYRHM